MKEAKPTNVLNEETAHNNVSQNVKEEETNGYYEKPKENDCQVDKNCNDGNRNNNCLGDVRHNDVTCDGVTCHKVTCNGVTCHKITCRGVTCHEEEHEGPVHKCCDEGTETNSHKEETHTCINGCHTNTRQNVGSHHPDKLLWTPPGVQSNLSG